MREKNEPKAKIGAGHAEAMFRLGIKELRQAVYFQESNIAQGHEYGIVGNYTPGEVAQSRESEGINLEEEKSVLAERLRELEGREDRERETPEMERG